MPIAARAAALLALLVSLPATAAPTPPPDMRPPVAVLYFDYTGTTEELTVLRKGIAQMLVSDLGGVDNVRLVERDRLQDVVEELELAKSRAIDPATAAKVGRLLGARYLVLGGYFDLLGALRVDARVVEVETGRILDSVGVSGKPGEFIEVEQALAGRLAEVLVRDVPPLPKTVKAPARKRPKPPAEMPLPTAVQYSEALDAKDRGDVAEAKKALEEVVRKAPDFELAKADLVALMQ